VATTGLKIYKRIIARYAICILAIIILVSLSSFYYQKEMSKKRFESDVKNSTEILASLLQGEFLEKIMSPEDFYTEVYHHLYRTIQIYQNESHLPIEAIKVLRRKGDVTSIVLSSDADNNIGAEYNLLHEMNPVFNSGSVEYKAPYLKGSLLVLSGFAPIKTSAGKIAGILQMDVLAKTGTPQLFSYVYIPVFIGIIVFILGLILFKLVLRPFQNSLSGLMNYIKKSLLSRDETKINIETLGYFEEVIHELELLHDELKKRQIHVEDKEQLQQQIKELMRIVNAASEGDFTTSATVTADALGVLADSFNLMIADLSTIIRDVKKSADHLATFTKDVLDTTKSMAQGADKQAGAMNDITTVIHRMSHVSEETDRSAQKSAESAQLTKNVAEHGSKILENSIKGMHHIRETVHNAVTQVNNLNDSSARIGEITKFIGDISTRTNLLALNATIEAARAGTAGRGFSIVAEEVRNLAERAKRATGEISNLIEEIQTGTANVVQVMDEGNREVIEGAKLVDEAGSALREILGSINITATSAQEIKRRGSYKYR
jgi:ABC-type transporter Mla subunit MlaD